MLRWLARILAVVGLGFGLTLALLPFTVDVTIATDPPVETTSDCDAPIPEAFREGVDGASVVDGADAEPELSEGFGCSEPARRRLALASGSFFIGACLLFASVRRRREAPVEVAPAPPAPAPAAPPAPAASLAPTAPPATDVDDTEAVRQHYESIREEERLATGLGQLELVRTRQVLGRHLPPAPATVLDVGGGTGVHAAWLAKLGYQVHVVDLTPRHVEEVARRLGEHGVTAAVGDARRLDAVDAGYDAVLLLGPLYHLPERADRLLALREAVRVVRPGGVVAVAAINRFASLFDGLARGFLFDADFREIVGGDLRDGRHLNPEGRPHWFTTAFFHHPGELAQEVGEAGLELEALVGVEGMAGWMAHLAEQWGNPEGRQVIVEAAQGIEAEPTLLGLSAHLLAVGRRPEGRRGDRRRRRRG